MAEIDTYATMTACLVRSMQSGSDLAKTFWQRMIDNAEDMMLPALELYSNGLMADSSMYEAFLASASKAFRSAVRPQTPKAQRTQ